MTQITRYFQIRLQHARRARSRERVAAQHHRWSTERTFERSRAAAASSTWLCHRYGFGTYLHYIPGQLDPETYVEGEPARASAAGRPDRGTAAAPVRRHHRLALDAHRAGAGVPDPGRLGHGEQHALFEFSTHDEAALHEVADGCDSRLATRMISPVLRHGEHFFGSRARRPLWLTWHDYENAQPDDPAGLHPARPSGLGRGGDPDLRRLPARARSAASAGGSSRADRRRAGCRSAEKNLRIIPTDDAVDFNSWSRGARRAPIW